jgi:hypothetical protein
MCRVQRSLVLLLAGEQALVLRLPKACSILRGVLFSGPSSTSSGACRSQGWFQGSAGLESRPFRKGGREPPSEEGVPGPWACSAVCIWYLAGETAPIRNVLRGVLEAREDGQRSSESSSLSAGGGNIGSCGQMPPRRERPA